MEIKTLGTTSLSKLVRAAQEGNREAYDGIVRRFQRMAILYAGSILGNRHNAEDAAQGANACNLPGGS